tara:strand:- start:17 stop:229 length:213 start_codon:yes stop_codon:yes gene_type:complete
METISFELSREECVTLFAALHCYTIHGKEVGRTPFKIVNRLEERKDFWTKPWTPEGLERVCRELKGKEND